MASGEQPGKKATKKSTDFRKAQDIGGHFAGGTFLFFCCTCFHYFQNFFSDLNSILK